MDSFEQSSVSHWSWPVLSDAVPVITRWNWNKRRLFWAMKAVPIRRRSCLSCDWAGIGSSRGRRFPPATPDVVLFRHHDRRPLTLPDYLIFEVRGRGRKFDIFAAHPS